MEVFEAGGGAGVVVFLEIIANFLKNGTWDSAKLWSSLTSLLELVTFSSISEICWVVESRRSVKVSSWTKECEILSSWTSKNWV